jgi:hypothetical protein
MHDSLHVSLCTLTTYIFYIIFDSVTYSYIRNGYRTNGKVWSPKSKASTTATDRKTYLIQASPTRDGFVRGGELYFNLENYFTDYFKNLVHVSSLSDYWLDLFWYVNLHLRKGFFSLPTYEDKSEKKPFSLGISDYQWYVWRWSASILYEWMGKISSFTPLFTSHVSLLRSILRTMCSQQRKQRYLRRAHREFYINLFSIFLLSMNRSLLSCVCCCGKKS